MASPPSDSFDLPFSAVLVVSAVSLLVTASVVVVVGAGIVAVGIRSTMALLGMVCGSSAMGFPIPDVYPLAAAYTIRTERVRQNKRDLKRLTKSQSFIHSLIH